MNLQWFQPSYTTTFVPLTSNFFSSVTLDSLSLLETTPTSCCIQTLSSNTSTAKQPTARLSYSAIMSAMEATLFTLSLTPHIQTTTNLKSGPNNSKPQKPSLSHKSSVPGIKPAPA